MNGLIFVLLILAYLCIGGFISGLDGDDDDMRPFTIFFWPFIYALILVFGIVSVPIKFGEWMHDKAEELIRKVRFKK